MNALELTKKITAIINDISWAEVPQLAQRIVAILPDIRKSTLEEVASKCEGHAQHASDMAAYTFREVAAYCRRLMDENES